MKKLIIIPVAIFLIMLLVPTLFYYRGSYHPPTTKLPYFEEITGEAPTATEFSETYGEREGIVLLDLSHLNQFERHELHLLTLRILSRGYSFEYLEEAGELEEKLRFADAFAIALPGEKFSEIEIRTIKRFVAKGGKLLLIADPTRPSQINSVATEFGLIFEPDFLYNMHQYEGNFRNIFLSEFDYNNELTKNLERIVFYCAGSISSEDKGIVFTNENTLSSIMGAKGRLSPVALTVNSRVVALSDLSFMTPPFNTVVDNNRFISNIADWLTESERIFILSDFPHFFEDTVDITYADASLLKLGLELKNFLIRAGKQVELEEYEDRISKETVFLGLFADAAKVEGYLRGGKISINDTVRIEGVGELAQSGTSLFYLDGSNGRHVLIILSENKDALGQAIQMLKSGGFRDWLVGDTLAIHCAPGT